MNRDLENNKVVEKDELTGALDAELDIDNRLFSTAGRKQKLKDLEDLPKDIYNIAAKVLEDGYSSVKGLIDGNNKERVFGEELLQKIKADPKLANEFMNLYEENPEAVKEILQNLGNMIEDSEKVKKEREKGGEARHNDEIILYNNDDLTRGYNYVDARDIENKEELIGINSEKTNLNSFGEVLSVMLHEKQNIEGHKDNEKADESLMKHLIRYNNILDRYYDYNDIKVNDKNAATSWNEKYKDNSVLTSGNLARDRQYNTAESFKGTSDEEKVKFNEAKIGKRPIDIEYKGKDYGQIPYKFQNDWADKNNIEGVHEHIFFEDEIGGNIGFTNKDGLFVDKEKNIPKYKITETGYDDSTMRQAIENIKDRYPAESYKTIGHNCQNFVEDVRQEYKKIIAKKS